MNEWCIYIALYCVLPYTQSALQSCGGSLLNHHQCAASTWMMRRQPQYNGASALTTHQLQAERRESHRANQVDWSGGGVVVSEFSGAWGKREEGGRDGRELSFLTAWWMKLSFSLLVLAWRLCSLLLMAADWRSCVSGGWDHLQCRGLCGWDGCKCPGGRGERHQRSSQLLSLCVEGSCGRMRCKRLTTQWCS